MEPTPANRGYHHARLLREFFERNPDEEMTLKDMMTKTGLSLKTIRNYVGYLTKDGVVERESIYRLKKDVE